jgi:hypothetical protein
MFTASPSRSSLADRSTPASKRAAVQQNDDCCEPVLTDFNPDNVYDTLLQ